MKIYTRYQVYDSDGNPVLEPYKDKCAAQYMVDAYFIGGSVIEVEVVS